MFPMCQLITRGMFLASHCRLASRLYWLFFVVILVLIDMYVAFICVPHLTYSPCLAHFPRPKQNSTRTARPPPRRLLDDTDLSQLSASARILQPWKMQDWSFAGYKAGSNPVLPPRRFDVVANYCQGCNDGNSDASLAIQAAIDDADTFGGGTVYLMPGRYRIDRPINITGNNIVLKGSGPTQTTLYMPCPLCQCMEGKYLEDPNMSKYCWKDGFLRIWGKSRDSPPSSASHLASVTAPADLGSTSLTVDSVKNLQAGQWVRIYQSDPDVNATGTGSLAKEMYGGVVMAPNCHGACFHGLNGHPNLFHWASEISSIDATNNKVGLRRHLPIRFLPAWRPQLHSLSTTEAFVTESGIQDLKVEFQFDYVQKHHLDKGYNAIELKTTFNSWVSNVEIINADHGILVQDSFSVTLHGIKISSTAPRCRGCSTNGHIGIGLVDSTDVLVDKFAITSPMVHDTTVVRTMMAVWRAGKGTNLNLDAHRHAPYATLYSDIQVGAGSRPFATGGVGEQGFPIAAYTTYYNIRNAKYSPILIRNDTAPWGRCAFGGGLLSYIGRFSASWKDCPSMHVVRVKGSFPEPVDWYLNQLHQRRIGRSV